MHESHGGLGSSPLSIAYSSTAKAAPAPSPIFPARSPEPATEVDRSGLTSSNQVGLTSSMPVGDSGIFLMRTGRLCAPSSPIPGVGLSGLVPGTESTVWVGSCPALKSLPCVGLCPAPRAESTALGGLVPRTECSFSGELPLTSTAFHDVRNTSHVKGLMAFLFPREDSSLVFLPPSPPPKAVPTGSRFLPPLFRNASHVQMDGHSASPRRFVARISASVATAEVCTGRRSIYPAADSVFASVFVISIDGGTDTAEALAAATAVAHPIPIARSSTQETDSAATSVSTAFISALIGTPSPPSATTYRQPATSTGNVPRL